jgi:prevent-host-death family protein
MTITTISSREFNQDTAHAKRAAAKGAVVVTDRGRPTHVLLTYARYQELTGAKVDIATLLGSAEAAEIEFEPARAGTIYRPADFS